MGLNPTSGYYSPLLAVGANLFTTCNVSPENPSTLNTGSSGTLATAFK